VRQVGLLLAHPHKYLHPVRVCTGARTPTQCTLLLRVACPITWKLQHTPRAQNISDYKQVQAYYYSLSVSSDPSGKCLSLRDKLRSLQRLCQQVRVHVLGPQVLNDCLALVHTLLDPEIPYINVSRALCR
jgi:hypothetical protein